MTRPTPYAPDAAVADLRSVLDGPILAPGDAGYDQARSLFYGAFDRRPAAIAQVESSADVARALRTAHSIGLDVTVRSGGHSVAGHSVADGALVIDLSRMRALDIDLAGRTAWAETGLTAGDYTSAAGTHELATGFGDTPTVGIGGITLGGGIGLLVRKHGLTIDSLLAAEVVTADGEVLRVDAGQHPDLFWALRGAGSNFGVVTRLQLSLHQVGTVLGGMMILPAEPRVVAGLVAEAEAAPEELSLIANVAIAPPLPFIPAEFHGQLIALVLAVYAGEVEDGERALKPIRGLAKPLLDQLQAMPYAAMFEEEGGPPAPAAFSIRNMFLDRFDEDDAAAALEGVRSSTAPMATTQIRVLGGAVARVPADATAFAHRQRRLMVNVAAGYGDPAAAEEHDAWASDLAATLGGSGAYVGFLGDEGPHRLREAYPGATLDRLAAVKATYDPDNVFRGNHNIRPATKH